MKKLLAVLLAFTMLILSACARDAVIDEIPKTGNYMETETEIDYYISKILGENSALYDIDVLAGLVRYSIKYDDDVTKQLSHIVNFTDGTTITVPCTYSQMKNAGWKVESNTGICTNAKGWEFTYKYRNTEDDSPSTNDRTIESIYISCGDFSTKDGSVLILSSHPDFQYMGIDRTSSPQDVVFKLGLPSEIEHNGVNMTFVYEISENLDVGTLIVTKVEFGWLALNDGTPIMRDVEIREFIWDLFETEIN